MSANPMPFKGPVEGYVFNFLGRNIWRVKEMMEWDDAMQEARLVFCEVCIKYPDAEPKHLMALFKTAWSNHFVDLAYKATKVRAEVSEQEPVDDNNQSISALRHESVGDSDNDGMLMVMIRQAPQEIQTVLSLFLNAPGELLELAIGSWKRKGHKRAEGNKMVNKCLGLPEHSDPLGQVEKYFLGND